MECDNVNPKSSVVFSDQKQMRKKAAAASTAGPSRRGVTALPFTSLVHLCMVYLFVKRKMRYCLGLFYSRIFPQFFFFFIIFQCFCVALLLFRLTLSLSLYLSHSYILFEKFCVCISKNRFVFFLHFFIHFIFFLLLWK